MFFVHIVSYILSCLGKFYLTFQAQPPPCILPAKLISSPSVIPWQFVHNSILLGIQHVLQDFIMYYMPINRYFFLTSPPFETRNIAY